MMFIVRVGTVIPKIGPSGGGSNTVIGVVEAETEDGAAEKLGLVKWDGWRNIPDVNAAAWEEHGGSYFFAPFDTKKIDCSPELYATVERRMRIITLHPTKVLESVIPDSVWEKF